MAGPNTLTFDDANFEQEVLKSDIPVLVDFWAEWCGPCVMLAPTIDDLATEYKGRVRVGKLDIDKSPRTAARYNVQSIPTVILYVAGQPAERIVGARRPGDYKAILDAKVAAA